MAQASSVGNSVIRGLIRTQLENMFTLQNRVSTMARFRQTEEIVRTMSDKERIRNVGIVAHIDHGKTTLTDSLLAAAGLLPRELAGSARVLDYLEEEQKRKITIKSANISLLHRVGDRSFLVNLADTPGHVDFTGRVTQALRAVDGVIVVVDAVEEVMSQTETVIRQALREGVKPVLFINKVDRLIDELKLSAREIEAKFKHIILSFNNLVEAHAEQKFVSRWKVDPAEGSVVFGSATDKWAISADIQREKGLSFRQVLAAYENEDLKRLQRILPLSHAVLNMIVRELPNPKEAQKYRIPAMWTGDLESEVGRAMLNCDDNGPLTMVITSVRAEKEELLATVRLFSGILREDEEVYLMDLHQSCLIDRVLIGMGARTDRVNEVRAGAIAVLRGLERARVGETIVDASCRESMVPFERIKPVSEPVITVAVEPKDPKDLSNLSDALNRLQIEDPNVKVGFSKETGEYLLTGMGELHLEIAAKTLKEQMGQAGISISKPSVNYRETAARKGKIVRSESANKENVFRLQVEPVQDLTKGAEGRSAWVKDANGNVLYNFCEKSQVLEGMKEMIVSGFRWACGTGPLCEQPLRNVQVKLLGANVSDDPEKRQGEQVSKAISRGIYASFLTAKPTLLEPVYRIEITVPPEFVGECSRIATQRRATIKILQQKNSPDMIIRGYIPVGESFGLATELRSATSGRAFWQSNFDHWDRAPKPIANQLIRDMRSKRGLQQTLPKPEDFAIIEEAS